MGQMNSVSISSDSAGKEIVSDAPAASERERWPSRLSFIFAAIGSAVGIGNLWRFPYQSFKYGGGAFFLPYFLALFFIGIPMLQLEFSLGQTFQGGHLKSFDRVDRRFRGLGIAAPFFAFVVTTYYSAILGWSLIYFVNSFQGDLPWAVSASETKECGGLADEIICNSRDTCSWSSWDNICKGAVLKKATKFFVDSINLEADPDATMSLSGSGFVVLALFVTWVGTFLAIAKGAKFLGYVVYFTMGVPLVLLLVLTIRGATLSGAGEGVKHYIGIWDMTQLTSQPDMWSAAVGQIFFSIGVCYGVMTAYASFNAVGQNVIQDSFIVSLSNSAVSIIAGFAVFSIAGHLAEESGQDISDLKSAGVGLVFWTFPTGLAQMPTPAAQIFSVLFFLTFFLLGIDSAFSLAEALTTILCDGKRLSRVHRLWIVAPVCVGGFLIGLFYASGIGLYILDSVDYYVNSIATLFVGFAQATSAGWFYGIDIQNEKIGTRAVWVFNTTFFVSLIVGCGIGFGADQKASWTAGTTVGGILAPCVALPLLIVGVGLAYWLCHEYSLEGEPLSPKTRLYYLTMANVEQLREDLNSVVAQNRDCGCGPGPKILSSLTPAWSALMKFAIPAILLILLSQSFSDSFLAYEDLPGKYQAAGTVIAFLGISIVFVAFFYPPICEALMPLSDECPLDLMKSTKQSSPNDTMDDDDDGDDDNGRVIVIGGGPPPSVRGVPPEAQESLSSDETLKFMPA